MAIILVAHLLFIWWVYSPPEPGADASAAPRPLATVQPRQLPLSSRDKPAPIRAGELMKLGNTEVFVKGLRELLLHLRTRSSAHLKRAAAHFDRACAEGPGEQATASPPLLRLKFLMYRAYAHEQRGDTGYRDELIRSGAVTRDNYYFYFHHKPTLLKDLVLARLRAEDSFIRSHLQRALEQHAQANGGRYPASLKALVPGYLRGVPMDPVCPTMN